MRRDYSGSSRGFEIEGGESLRLDRNFKKDTKTCIFRIFVPSSRNKLADILLGKASPVKKLNRRSTSASPSKGRGKAVTQVQSLVPDTPVVESNCRRSPRKRMKGASGTKGGGELPSKFTN